MESERGKTIAEAADILRMSRRSLQEIIKRHPYYYPVGRRKIFTSADIEKIRVCLRSEVETVEQRLDERRGGRTKSWTPSQARSVLEQAIYDRLTKRKSKSKN